MKKQIFILILSIFFIQTALIAEDYSGDVYVAGVTKYLWRGQILNRKATLQPGLDLNYKKLSIGLWASFNVADSFESPSKEEFGEADMTISFSDSYSLLGFSLGYTYYTFPVLAGPGVSAEYFLGLSLDVFLSPGITLYWDIAPEDKGGGDGLYAELALSYPLNLGIEFAIDTSLGYNAGQWNYVPSPTVWGLSLGTTISIGPLDITPSVFVQIALDDQYKNPEKNNAGYDGFASLTAAYNF